MYKAILCDDNEIILEGLKTQINWIQLNIDLCATASNGKDALQIIKKYSPDILITDIKMPLISGLDLAKAAKKINPQIIILFISGYDDFEYAREAIHIGALDYILKPINIESFYTLLKSAVENCDKLQQFKNNNLINIFKKLINKSDDSIQLIQSLRNTGVPNNIYHCIVFVEMNLKNLQILSDEIIYSVEKKFSAINKLQLNQGCYLINQNDYKYEFLLTSISKIELTILHSKLIDNIRKIFPYKQSFIDLSISSSDFYFGIENLDKSYYSAKEAMKLHFVKGANVDIEYKEIENYANAEKTKKGVAVLPPNINLVTVLKSGDKTSIDNELNKLYQWLNEKGSNSYLYMTVAIGNIYTNLIKEIEDTGIDIKELLGDPILEFNRITTANTLDDCIENLRNTLYHICDYYNKNRSKYSKIINSALSFIQLNFNNPNLNIVNGTTDAIPKKQSHSE